MSNRKTIQKINIEDFNILYDNVFVEGLEIEERDGIKTPSSYDEKPELGRVLAVGEGRIFDNGHIEPLRVQVGDVVYFNKYSSVKFNFDGRDFFVVHEEDITGYLRNYELD